jgi:hypothetical protein
MGPADGAAAARNYAALSGGMDSDVSAAAVRDDELLHDAGVDTGLPVRWKAALAVTAAVVVVLVLVALLKS